MRGDRAAILAFAVLVLAGPAHAAELKQKTAEAFDRYAHAAEARMERELGEGGAFLWVDRLSAAERERAYAELRAGRVWVEHVEPAGTDAVRIPDGLVHDWVAVAFIPGATLEQVLAVMQDYDRHASVYRPEVQRAKLLNRQGDDFRFSLRLYQKKIVSATLNAEFEAHYARVDATHAWSRAYSRRIAEVNNPGEANEHEKPIGIDRGFLWRLNSYWRFEAKDGGVYVQLETLALSRSVPAIFAWLVNPLLKSLPREYLSRVLNQTRGAFPERGTASATSR